jgi:hypothetical protein
VTHTFWATLTLLKIYLEVKNMGVDSLNVCLSTFSVQW